ncbi:MAG: RNA pyrophosphohydrolase [Helicobacteraceae bacterium]|nr:RNA pyrophosphohydrolase [Helicobacteraceae bacterium]
MKKNYRPNVAAVILSSQYPNMCELFIAERSDVKGAWQFPQGGIDKNEDARTALFRELNEEIGTNEVEIIAEHPDWISYDFPMSVADKMYPYDGQKQKYFLVRLKNSAEINLDTKSPEFTRFKFVPMNEALKKVSFFKRPIYKRVLAHFKKSGYL